MTAPALLKTIRAEVMADLHQVREPWSQRVPCAVVNNMDAALLKNFKVRESMRLQVRGEALDIPTTRTSTESSRISTAADSDVRKSWWGRPYRAFFNLALASRSKQ